MRMLSWVNELIAGGLEPLEMHESHSQDMRESSIKNLFILKKITPLQDGMRLRALKFSFRTFKTGETPALPALRATRIMKGLWKIPKGTQAIGK